MKNKDKTKSQLLNELAKLRQRIAELEKSVTEHNKRAEEALGAERDKFDTITRNIGVGLAIISKDYKTLWANEVLKEIFGDVVGKVCYVTYNQRTEVCLGCGVKEVFATGKDRVVHEQKGKDAQGNLIWSQIIATPIKNKEGNIKAAQEVIVPITERKKAEEALRESERFLQNVFDGIQDGIIVLDCDLNITHVNLWVENMYAAETPLVGKKCYEIYQKRQSPCPWCPSIPTIETGDMHTEIVPYPSAEKPTGWIELSAYPLKDTVGKVQGVIEHAKDITSHKRAEKELRESEEKYRTLTENINVGIYRSTPGPKGNFIEANPAIIKMFGYRSKKEFLTINVSDLYQNPEDRKKFNEKMLSDGFVRSEELQLKKKDGTPITTSVSAVAVKEEKGKVKYYDGIIEDISEHKRAEEKIKASLKEKEVLLQEVHHRVKNNMQIISSLFNLQSRRIKDKKAYEIFKSSQNRVRSMALIHERLYQSKDFARIDCTEYVQVLTRHLFSSYGINPNVIKLNINIKDVLMDINTAIPCGLIINELVSNSLKHGFPGGKKGEIKIAMHPLNENEIELIVSDNGIGLPEEVDFRDTESLGLHLVTILAEDQLHGEIKLDRTRGTSFHIRFRVKR